MINVAICDDVVSTTGKIETMLQNIAKRNFNLNEKLNSSCGLSQ